MGLAVCPEGVGGQLVLQVDGPLPPPQRTPPSFPAGGLVGVRKRYGAVEALRGVDLAVPRGQIVAVLGPNGAGKTTAIQLMLGLRRPSAGTVHLFGLDPRRGEARGRCGAMLQDSG